MSNQNVDNAPVAANAKRLLWAGFMAIFAAGMGFGVRGGIFDNWAGEYGFTATQLGAIGGAGFTGFCFGIIIGGLICDKIGYGKLVVAAFAFHVLSAVVTFGASTPQNAYQMLTIGMFIFSFANGTLEGAQDEFNDLRTGLGCKLGGGMARLVEEIGVVLQGILLATDVV
jgi:MFS family permease